MVDTTQSEWNFFQFDPSQMGNDWAVGSSPQQMRGPAVKMSNFGALNYGSRFSFDRTRTDFEFGEKDEMQGADKFGLHTLRASGAYEAERDRNPYVLNSTVKKVRDDQFARMGMSMGGKDALALNHAPSTGIDQPKYDEMDTKVSRGSWTSTKNYPTEGWRTFGGKYDFHVPYDGTLR